MPTSEMDPASMDELNALMKEFPDWKEKHPDMYHDMYPQRFCKIAGKKDVSSQPDRVIHKRNTAVPPTDYQNTYVKHRAYRPRSTKRPPPTPLEVNPPPMTFDTFQRSDFTPKDVTTRTEPIKMEEQYTAPEGKIEGLSHYRREYPGHKALPELRLHAPDWSRGKSGLIKTNGKFHSDTTTGQHYKKWKSAPPRPFGELPSFAGSILYPDAGHKLQTTTSDTYKGAPGRRADLVQMSEGHIKLEGDMEMDTTHRSVFHTFADPRPATKVNQKPDQVMKSRDKFDATTQSKRDFPGFSGRQPRPPRPAEPAPETIDLKFNTRQCFDTEQRRQFPGVDPKEHPVPKSCKKDDETYKPPYEKFETLTSQKVSFAPIDVEQVYSPPVKPISKRRVEMPKFDDHTTSKDFFKKWDTTPRIRYGDFHGAHDYIPPVDRFSAKTTNQDFYLGKSSEVPKSYKPEDKAMEVEGESDFKTMYRVTFNEPMASKRLNKSQAHVLLNELRQRKGINTIPMRKHELKYC